MWDHMAKVRPEFVRNKDNADVACDSYHRYKDDVALLKDLGVQFYRLSISWSRILPTGFPNKINQKGINYYNRLINELIANKIQPMVTIFHWDLPQPLQALGGFSNPLVVDWYLDFARVCFENFGDRVKLWLTFNEVRVWCQQAYGEDGKAPALGASGIADYLCIHHCIKGHAKAYHLYNNTFRATQKGSACNPQRLGFNAISSAGSIGIVQDSMWSEPGFGEGAKAAAERARQFYVSAQNLLLKPLVGATFYSSNRQRIQSITEMVTTLRR